MSTIQHSVEDLKVIYDKVRVDSRLSLQNLRVVDVTVHAATHARNSAQTGERSIEQFLAELDESGGYVEAIDPKNKLAVKSASAEAYVKNLIMAFKDLGKTWRDSSIYAAHAEDVSERIEEAIVALQKQHDKLVDLRWAIMEHDADLDEPVGKAYDNVEDLFANLKGR